MENIKPSKFIVELMEGKSEQEMLEAEHRLRKLLQVLWKIHCRKEGLDPDNTLDFIGDFKDY